MPVVKTYQQGVLIHNWFEDLVRKKKESRIRNPKYRIDHMQLGYQKPDVIMRRGGEIESGKGHEYVANKYEGPYSDNMITWYDEDYNRRQREVPGDQLPPLRHFDRQLLKWEPERRDFPVRGRPTSWGLAEQKREKWAKDMETQNQARTSISDYKIGFHPFSSDFLNESLRKKYDVNALTASSTVPLSKPLDPLYVAAHCKRL